MKFVVIGWSAWARIASRSSRKHSRSWSSVYRAQSSFIAGLTTVGVRAGATTCSQSA